MTALSEYKAMADQIEPVRGADLRVGHRVLGEHVRTWSSPITHFVDLPEDYWGRIKYGWTRQAFAGRTPLRLIVPDQLYAVRADTITPLADAGGEAA